MAASERERFKFEQRMQRFESDAKKQTVIACCGNGVRRGGEGGRKGREGGREGGRERARTGKDGALVCDLCESCF